VTQPASPVLVTGATGNTGRAVAEALARRGVPVRAMVRAEADRDRLPAGVQPVVAAAALTSALGRDITFIDVPPDVFAASLQAILPPWQIQGLLEDYAHYRRGEAA
jgi:NAD(P)-dependent dehydrogenase (short-subunit alcohol dehydrogenase family)